MDASRWRRIDDVFQAAISRPADERPAFLLEACGGDAALQRELEQLLAAHAAGAAFLEAPAFADGLRVLAADAPLPFPGTDRYAVIRQLGAGGMGVVYEVLDRTRNEVVALKTLLRARAADIYRLKREFRSLADIAHPNLVSLYELVVDGEHCFFTMELVRGANLVDYVRGASGATPLSDAGTDRARSVLRQLIDGLSALHRKGKLHRDIKPSNVLVTPQGRVVILDFGLISDAQRDNVADLETVAGTPAYIAPEQAPGVAPAEANDWYSVGVTLYEALTGRLPIEGRAHELLQRKSHFDPPSPSEIAPGIPADLSEICVGLLSRDPARRWSGLEAVRRLAGETPPPTARAHTPGRRPMPFVGRADQLDILHRALLGAAHGRAGVVCIHGSSGIGKSALAQRFLDQALERTDVVVLRGRCYEHESVPYKALDGVIDNLTQHLDSLDRSGTDLRLPRDVLTLSRVFPVMRQVPAIAGAHRPEPEIEDPIVLRQHAFAALRQLLAGIAARRPLVLYIDDLHWADADSVLLLEELLRPPQPPPLLTVTCFRTEEIAAKPFLQRLIDGTPTSSCMLIPLAPMSEEESRALIESFIPADTSVTEADQTRIVRDGGGNPLVLEQLARYVSGDETGRHQHATFAEMLDGHLRTLPAGARAFLDTLAICGRPVAPQLVHAASGLAGDERPLVTRLRSDRFVRSSGSAERVEIYHDRIRETLAARLSPGDRRRLHSAMAGALLAHGSDDPEALCDHYRGAGDHPAAAIQAARAAKKADAVLAFDRAASLYRLALELAPDSPQHGEWTESVAGALANAARPTEAAEAYLDAAGRCHPWRRVELQRRAAEQLLIGGHIDRGLDVIRVVASGVGIDLAIGSPTALVSFLVRRVWLRCRGLEFVERDAAAIPAADLFRIDTCWSLSTGLALVDNILAADFHTRHLLLALAAGEPRRVGNALAIEAAITAIGGGRTRRRTAAVLARARAVAERSGDARAVALCTLTEGLAAYMMGQWKSAATTCERTLDMLRDRLVGVTWEWNFAQNILLASLLHLGEYRELSRRLSIVLASARERGNRYIETELHTIMIASWLAADDPDGGERQANAIMARWAHSGFHRQHHNYLLTRIRIALYRGESERAWQLLTEHWTAVKRSHGLRTQWMRIEAWFVRARCALFMATTRHGRERRRFLAVARADVRRIEREAMPWGQAMASMIDACVTYLEGDAGRAAERLSAAIDGFDRADMAMYAAMARRRLGRLLGGDRGGELLRQSDDWCAAQDFKNPDRMARLVAPGFPDAAS